MVRCQCEHESHFEPVKTPNGNPGHRYGAAYAETYMRKCKTAYTTLTVCKDCAKDCLHDYVIGEPRKLD